jgi:hypothetical protein
MLYNDNYDIKRYLKIENLNSSKPNYNFRIKTEGNNYINHSRENF